jgi:hypothetical protein
MLGARLLRHGLCAILTVSARKCALAVVKRPWHLIMGIELLPRHGRGRFISSSAIKTVDLIVSLLSSLVR